MEGRLTLRSVTLTSPFAFSFRLGPVIVAGTRSSTSAWYAGVCSVSPVSRRQTRVGLALWVTQRSGEAAGQRTRKKVRAFATGGDRKRIDRHRISVGPKGYAMGQGKVKAIDKDYSLDLSGQTESGPKIRQMNVRLYIRHATTQTL